MSLRIETTWTLARLWADLMTVEGAIFEGSFDRVIFAILGKKTLDTFKEALEELEITSGDS